MIDYLGYTDLFFKNFEAYKEGYRYVVNQGSARSTKSFSILQLLLEIANGTKHEIIISIVGKTLPFLKRGALRDFKIIVQAMSLWNEKNFNRTEQIYTLGNAVIEFFSVDQPEKVFGAARDILFIDEPNTVNENIFQQLAIRTRGTIFLAFNPTHEFWAISDIAKRRNAKLIKSSYLNNPFLSKSIKDELEEAGKRNANFKRVFVDGEVGKLEGVVFDNWDIGEFDTSLDFIFGQDFGFASDPSTLVKIAVDEGKKIIYLDECFYKNGLTTNSLFELNRQYAGNRLIVADRSNPRLIDELKALGNNIVPAVSADGSGVISTGLLTMQDYMIIVTENSTNLMNELKTYVWLDERGKLAIDKFNHAIDAARYGFMYVKHQSRHKFYAV